MNGQNLFPLSEPPPEHVTLQRFLRASREVLETIVPAVLIAILINLFLAQATRVYGQSMEPNLHTDQRVIVEKLSYHLHAPRRGDVVVLRREENGGELLIKRVVGLPGEQITIRDGQVLVDGKQIDEPYLREFSEGHYGPVDVPPLHIFVLGDNRRFSNDSRAFGTVALEDVIGRAWFSYWPPSQIGFIR